MTVAPPPDMDLPTWTYVCDFTQEFEGPVPFMYNNYPLKSKAQDVTCGVGIRIDDEAAACRADIKGMFRVKGTPNVPSDTQMKEEFRRVRAIDRTEGNLNDYPKGSKLEMDKEAMWDGMRIRIKSWLAGQREPGVCPYSALLKFATMPAQAQAAIAIFNYGWRIKAAPNMCRALAAGDYDTAAKESYLEKLDAPKLIGIRTLFYNAARIVEQGLPSDTPPRGFKPPTRIEWVATATSSIAPRLPDAGR